MQIIQKLVQWLQSLFGVGQVTEVEVDLASAEVRANKWFVRQRRVVRRAARPRRSTLRRQTGGWSGAVAISGRVS
jgi:hypothetical protein